MQKAQKGHYAVPAFNINNLEALLGIMQAAVELKAPIFVSTSEGAIKYAGMDYLGAMVRVAAKENVPVAFHLDHGKDLAVIKEAIQSGYYTSVMIDGSALEYKENLKITKKVAMLAHKKKISVEAELGAIRGVEDLVSVSERDAFLTNPKQAKEFVSATQCDSLGVAIGTAHGAFKFMQKAKLDINRLSKIKKSIAIPLVLHGASAVPRQYVAIANKYGAKIKGAKGNSDTEIRKAIMSGICKINIDTDLRIAFLAGVRSNLKKNSKNIDPRKYLGEGTEYIYRVAKHKIKLFGCAGKA